jgi:integrase
VDPDVLLKIKATKRRSPGEGSVWPYQTKAGERWAIGHPSFGTRRNASGWGKTKRTAQQALRDMLLDASRGELVDPSKQPTSDYLDQWAEGLRLAPSTVASYRKNIRLHIAPYIGTVPLNALTTERIDRLYRDLERRGRADHREGAGLSPRTVRYVHTILSAALAAAVKTKRLTRNPAADASPPTARQAKSPEMTCWSAAQLAAFLGWARERAPAGFPLWHVLAFTGMRRGEALALRWRDVDLDTAALRIRRSAGMIRNAGEGAGVVEGDTKSGKPRLIDLDAPTAAVLRAHRRERGALALQLARDDALVFGDIEGYHRNPEHTSRQFARDVGRCCDELGSDALPRIRLHDLRHTHATIMLSAREPVHVVSARLGHASPVVTMTVYAHVLPGSQRHAADHFAALVEGGK